MPVAKLTCPNCHAVLKQAKPLPSGKEVKCPKCAHLFTVPEEEVQDVIGLAPEEPAPTPSRFLEDEDSGPATYRFQDELEAPKKKPKRYDDDDDDDDDADEIDERDD